MDEYKFGKELFKIMNKKGITIDSMSIKTNIDVTSLEKKLNGDDNITANELIEIMLFLNLSITEVSTIYEKCKHFKK